VLPYEQRIQYPDVIVERDCGERCAGLFRFVIFIFAFMSHYLFPLSNLAINGRIYTTSNQTQVNVTDLQVTVESLVGTASQLYTGMALVHSGYNTWNGTLTQLREEYLRLNYTYHYPTNGSCVGIIECEKAKEKLAAFRTKLIEHQHKGIEYSKGMEIATENERKRNETLIQIDGLTRQINEEKSRNPMPCLERNSANRCPTDRKVSYFTYEGKDDEIQAERALQADPGNPAKKAALDRIREKLCYVVCKWHKRHLSNFSIHDFIPNFRNESLYTLIDDILTTFPTIGFLGVVGTILRSGSVKSKIAEYFIVWFGGAVLSMAPLIYTYLSLLDSYYVHDFGSFTSTDVIQWFFDLAENLYDAYLSQ